MATLQKWFTDWNFISLEVIQTSYSVVHNTSNVSWTLKHVAGSEGRIVSLSNSKIWQVTINGEIFGGETSMAIGNNETKVLASGRTTVPHNTDGTKSISFSFYQALDIAFSGIDLTSISGSRTMTLPKIPRASQPSCITWPENTQNVGNFGSQIYIYMNRQSSEFTHTVRYAFTSDTGVVYNIVNPIATGVTNNIAWTIPESLMIYLPNSTSGSGEIYVDTYSGSTLVGTKSCGFTATVPSSVKPSCTATLTDITEVDQIYGSPVQKLSKIQVETTATQAWGSPIKSYHVKIDGKNYTSSDITSDYLQNSGSSVVSVSVTDARGRTETWSDTISVLPYSPPSVTELLVHRCNADGTANQQGAYGKVTFSANVTALDDVNTASYQLRYKKSSSSTWTVTSIDEFADTYSVTDHTVIFPADENSPYDVGVYVQDRHNSALKTTSLSTAFALFDIHHSGTGMRFGGIAESEDTLQNDLELKQTANRYCFSTPGTAGTAGSILMARITHIDENADSPITFVFSRRLEATPMTVHVQFKSDSTTLDPDIKGITYEGSNYGAFIVKSDTSVWDLYVSKVSAYDTVTMQDWYTSATTSKRMMLEFPGTLVSAIPEPFYRATPAKVQSILDFIYPVNSIYISYSHDNPGTLFGGTWTRITNAFLWATTSGGTIGGTGGAQTVTLVSRNIPSHKHQMMLDVGYGKATSMISGNSGAGSTYLTGSGAYIKQSSVEANQSGYIVESGASGLSTPDAVNKMPPYIQVSVWRRTA